MMFDPFIFNSKWNAKDYFDGMNEPWMAEFVFVNPPFSITSVVLNKCIHEFSMGCNIALLVK